MFLLLVGIVTRLGIRFGCLPFQQWVDTGQLTHLRHALVFFNGAQTVSTVSVLQSRQASWSIGQSTSYRCRFTSLYVQQPVFLLCN